MIPISHYGKHLEGLMPYAKLRWTGRGWHGFAGDWRVFMLEADDDPVYNIRVLEGPKTDRGGLYERYRLRKAATPQGEIFLFGLTGTGYLLAFKQPKGQWGDWALYHCLQIPFQWSNL